VLAGIEEQLQKERSGEVEEKMTAVETLLAGLIDYAGLYPPASLDMRTAVANYLRYREGKHRAALGRFIVSADRIGELRSAAGDAFAGMRLSAIIPTDVDAEVVEELLDGCKDPAFECKVGEPAEVERISAQIAGRTRCYFEIPMGIDEHWVSAIKASGARVKLRMGGVVTEAFPQTGAVAVMLQVLAERRIAFKATAGLHHPIRSRHPFTYDSNSATGIMHGFLNLAFAATLLQSGGASDEALQMLEVEDLRAWRVWQDAIACRGVNWSTDQIRAMREQFFISFGSCSFEEPIRDLEVLGWL
jgi:hypothetical protein